MSREFKTNYYLILFDDGNIINYNKTIIVDVPLLSNDTYPVHRDAVCFMSTHLSFVGNKFMSPSLDVASYRQKLSRAL